MLVLIVSSLTAIVVSFFCSLSEATLLSLNAVKLETDRKEGWSYARILSGLRANINRPIAAILILNTVAHTGGATFAGSSFSELYGEEWMWAFSLVFTIVILFGTEILPKVLGVAFANNLAKFVAHPLNAMIRLLYPVVLLTEAFSNFFTRGKKNTTIYSLEDIHTIAESAKADNLIDSDQEKIIVKASNLKKRAVREIMLPLEKVVFLNESVSYDDYFSTAEQHLHTRYPVSKTDSAQDFVGYLNLKEIALLKDELVKDGLSRFVRPLLYVKENLNLALLMKQFSAHKLHLAIVQDHNGKNVGMVTLEDVVEQVVGSIQDEFDTE